MSPLLRTLVPAVVVVIVVAAVALGAVSALSPRAPPHVRAAASITVEGSGSGASAAPGSSLQARRLLAEREAKLDALHRLVDAIGRLPLDRGGTVDDVVPAAELHELAAKFRIVDTRYYQDGDVEVVARLDTASIAASIDASIDGALAR